MSTCVMVRSKPRLAPSMSLAKLLARFWSELWKESSLLVIMPNASHLNHSLFTLHLMHSSAEAAMQKRALTRFTRFQPYIDPSLDAKRAMQSEYSDSSACWQALTKPTEEVTGDGALHSLTRPIGGYFAALILEWISPSDSFLRSLGGRQNSIVCGSGQLSIESGRAGGVAWQTALW